MSTIMTAIIKPRYMLALVMIASVVVLWSSQDDVIELVLKQRVVLLGGYSEGGFAVRILLSLLLGAIGLTLLISRKRVREIVGLMSLIVLSCVLTVVVAVYASALLIGGGPRYIEVPVTQKDGAELTGLVRHRPPNQHFELRFTDQPETSRSYPGPPPGYGSVDIELTIDQYGFRNRDVKQRYPLLVVGDSFTAGSHVSDEQAWPVLLGETLDIDVYNLGVSGSDPWTYLNNYVIFGRRLQPDTVVFVIYAGNDLRTSVPLAPGEQRPLPLSEKLELIARASPITLGLRRLSRDYLQRIGARSELPDYPQQASWMPVRVDTPAGPHYYAFHPRRLMYGYHDLEAWRQNPVWLATSEVFLSMQKVARKDGARMLMLWVPSKPQLALAITDTDTIDAGQLHRFASYRTDNLPPPEVFKRRLLEGLDNQETVFMEFCQQNGIECLSTTAALREASAAGIQTYYSYDQHWTPDGNRIVAQLLAHYLSSSSPRDAIPRAATTQ